MKRGIVFKDENQELVLLSMDASLNVEEHVIGDDNHVYTTMPESNADIVEWDTLGEGVGLVDLKSILGMTFFAHQTECPAREAIRNVIAQEPYKFLKMLNEAL